MHAYVQSCMYIYMCTYVHVYMHALLFTYTCVHGHTYVHSNLRTLMYDICTYICMTTGKCFTCHVASLPSPPLLPPDSAKPLFGIMGSRSPASFQLGNIAAQFEEEEEGSEDSPTEDEEVGSHNAAAAFIPGHVFVRTYADICGRVGMYVRSYVCTYVCMYVHMYTMSVSCVHTYEYLNKLVCITCESCCC